MIMKFCDWCKEELAEHVINGDEVICDSCYEESDSCERCEVVVHQDSLIDGLCEICYDDMH